MTSPQEGNSGGSLVEAIRGLVDLAEQLRAKSAVEARGLIARAKAALGDAEQGWHDVGAILHELKKPALFGALDYSGLQALCRKELDLGPTNMWKMMRLSTAVRREQCAGLGLERADALLSLAKAIGGDALEDVFAGRTVELWSGGPRLEVGAAALNQLHEATRQARAHATELRAGQHRRGRRVEPADRAFAAGLNAELLQHSDAVQVLAKAGRTGQPASFTITGLGRTQCELAAKAILVALREPGARGEPA